MVFKFAVCLTLAAKMLNMVTHSTVCIDFFVFFPASGLKMCFTATEELMFS